MEHYQPPVKAPDFPPGLWLNTIDPISLRDQAGSILLIDIFDYTCINCIRTLPYLRAWHDRYNEFGLGLLGIHTPEFKFAHDPDVVKTGLARLGIHWPVMLDNDQSLWTAYANRYWPSLYLVDSKGKIRYRHVGEGSYQAIEAAIQELLLELDPVALLPDLLAPLLPEDAEGAFCAPTSPEVQLGSVHQLGQVLQDPQIFQIPEDLTPDRINLEGTWRITRDGITLVSQTGEIAIRYRAAKVHAVLAPNPDDRERLPFNLDPLYIQVEQDQEPLSRVAFGQDILADGAHARFRVDFPRLYNIVGNPEVGSHDLRLKIRLAGLTFYAFSFGSCLSGENRLPTRSKE
ncbi:MAG: redoxin domain-containing protein [Anaerolineales bacterium]|nr:MAG: redoxin domain-containing protein [Anaerolineales bacterium]